jgi:hypothetical protein
MSERDFWKHTQWAATLHAASRGAQSGSFSGINITWSLSDLHAYSGFFDEETIGTIKKRKGVSPDCILFISFYSFSFFIFSSSFSDANAHFLRWNL